MASALPFDDFRDLIRRLPAGDEAAGERVRTLLRRAGAKDFGRLEEIAAWLATWSGRAPPVVNRPLVALFAGTHGIAARGVTPNGPDWTAGRVEMCAAGGAAINQFCLAGDLGLKVFDLALHLPTADFSVEPALDERGCVATMAFGMEAIAGTDLLAIGDIGAGGSTAAAAIQSALHGGKGADWAGPGSGADAAMIGRKAELIDVALALHAAHLGDPLEILRRFGGREFAAIAGAIVAARMEKVPVILDGPAAFAVASVLHRLNPASLGHCLLAQVPTEPGCKRVAKLLGLEPVLDFGMGAGEGTGAALAAGIVKAAALTASGLAATIR